MPINKTELKERRNAMEKIILNGVSAVKANGNCYLSERFISIADTVVISAAAKGAGYMALYAFDKEGNRFEIKTVDFTEAEAGYTATYEFDPSSLAVYRNADSFEVELGVAEVTDFSAKEIIIEPSEMWRDDRNMLTTFEDGTPGVFSKTVSGDKIIVPRIPKKVLFIGNSLVFGMSHGYYGMCASAPDKDYFHYVSSYIKKFSPDCQFTKLYGSYLEHSENMEMFDDWYYRDAMKQFTVDDNYISAESMLDPELDLVFVQMGDNVNTDEKFETFIKALDIFIERIKGRCPHCRIVFVHSWFGIHKTGTVVKDVCEKWEVERVNISCLHNLATEARDQKTYVTRDGSLANVSERWISHPGDLGMKKIAERIIERLGLE